MKIDLEEFKTGRPAKREIVELHDFFQNWFNGVIDRDINRFSSTMAPDFELIHPSGKVIGRDEIISLVDQGYNTSNNRKIWVENVQTKLVGDLIVATYVELQETKGEETRRISTAIFSFDPNLPNNCAWHHVHETWNQQESRTS